MVETMTRMKNIGRWRWVAAGGLSRTIGCCMLVVLLFAGCERDHLYYGSQENAIIRVNVDWSQTQWEPNGATVYAYDASTGALVRRFDPFSNPNLGYISLPVGTYNIVLFNNTPAEFADKLLFVGDNYWNTFRTEANIDTKGSARSSAAVAVASTSRVGETFASEPDTFAVARIERFEVTEDMAHKYYYDVDEAKSGESVASITMVPHKVISKFKIRVHVKGLKYAKPPVYAYMRGLAKGYFMGLGYNTADPCTHAFILNNREWDEGSSKDGTISAEFNTFGLIPDGVTRADGKTGVLLDIDFVLTDGQNHPVSFDVTSSIEYVELDVETHLDIKLALQLELDVELPEVIGGDDPDDPEGGGGGFAPDVSEWDEEIIDFAM